MPRLRGSGKDELGIRATSAGCATRATIFIVSHALDNLRYIAFSYIQRIARRPERPGLKLFVYSTARLAGKG